MPHQCTACGRAFADGSKEMLSGCPDCGGNKFQFKPQGAADASPTKPANEKPNFSPDEVRGASDPAADTADSHGSTAPTGSNSEPSAQGENGKNDASTGTNSDSERLAETDAEDTAQASARSDVVSPDELNRASRNVSSSTPANDADPNVERPDIDDLRDELNAQFESIRIVSPGKYELNLMELYDRQEYIISLQEDGRYVIEMPDSWGISDE